MTPIASSALLSLSAVLLLSGLAKLMAPSSSRTIATTVDLPRPLQAPWVQNALPWFEIVLAVALALTSGPALVVSTAMAVCLFGFFTVMVHRGTRAPDPASCGCFGAFSRAAVSPRTVVRNLVFTLTALLALTLSLAGFEGPVLRLPVWGVVAGAIPALLVLVTLWSERSANPAGDSRDLAGVPPLPGAMRGDDAAASSGTAPAARGTGDHTPSPRTNGGHPGPQDEDDYERLTIPYAALTDTTGGTVTLRGLASTEARALFMVSTTCGSCTPVIERLAEIGGQIGPVRMHVVLAQDEEQEALPVELRESALTDARGEMPTLFQQYGNPWAVVLGADGLLAGGPVSGSGAVLEMLEELAERFAQ